MRTVIHTGQGLMLACLLAGGSVFPALASDEMPEVLRYARQYQAEKPVSRPAGKSPHRTVGPAAGASLSRQLARSELIRRQQQAQLQAQGKKLRVLEAERDAALQAMTARADALRRDLAEATGKQAALAKQVNDLQQEKNDLLAASGVDRRAQRTAQQKAEAALKAENERLSHSLAEASGKQAALAKQVNDLQQKADATLKEKTEELARQTAVLAALRKQADTLTTEKATLEKTVQRLQKKNPAETLSLKTALQQQAYAAGVMYARDVREAQEGNRLLGVDLDRTVLMAGLSDALGERPLKLEKNALAAASQALEKAAADGYTRVTKAQAAQARAWLKAFRKEKGTAQDAAGFWYRVTYAGDGELLQADDTVDVVVEESLPDGRVVSDMDRAGSSLRQTVSAFPPVFAAGLLRLRNHGQITLMVPPELAYGDKGYPPDVPPGATMIYRIRVADRIPAAAPTAGAVTQDGNNSKEKPVGRPG
ncbi:FKBP-type peptidyl-prolyl cis-trans isomerase N-terminal domain-containing protein [Salmonella enterica subsp. enterica]